MLGRRDVRTWLPASLAALIAAGGWPVARSAAFDDPSWCSPFLTPDSYDWINNGLYWAGAPLAPSLRPPGLPLLIALLSRLHALALLPYLGLAALAATAGLLCAFLLRRHGALASGFAAWIVSTGSFQQDAARTVMAEVYATALLVAAALLFERAAERPRLYRAFGATLAAGFLFHYAALVAGVGFLAAALLGRRHHLRLRDAWIGLVLAASAPAAWLLFRALRYAHRAPSTRIHVIEPLLGVSAVNVRFYLVAGIALLGLALLPLHAAGALRLIGDTALLRDPFRASYLAPLASLTVFWLFLYQFVAKRFLLYGLPFAGCVLAEGVTALVLFARGGRARSVFAAACLGTCALWNAIQVPRDADDLLALTPRDMIDLGLHIEGATVRRVHARLGDAFRGGFFDASLPRARCSADGRDALLAFAREVDARLPPGEPVGFHSGPGWPADYWSAVNRLSNAIRRPVTAPGEARFSVALGPVQDARVVARSGPYLLVERSSRRS